jgi:Tfp pilus assembly protein PilF
VAWLNDDLTTAQSELATALMYQPDVATLRLAAQIHEQQRDSVQALAFYKQVAQRLETEALGESSGERR